MTEIALTAMITWKYTHVASFSCHEIHVRIKNDYVLLEIDLPMRNRTLCLVPNHPLISPNNDHPLVSSAYNHPIIARTHFTYSWALMVFDLDNYPAVLDHFLSHFWAMRYRTLCPVPHRLSCSSSVNMKFVILLLPKLKEGLPNMSNTNGKVRVCTTSRTKMY